MAMEMEKKKKKTFNLLGALTEEEEDIAQIKVILGRVCEKMVPFV